MISFRLSQSENTLSGVSVKLLGIVTPVRFLQSQNADSFISVTLSGIIILIFKLKVYKKSSKISNVWILRRFFVYTLIKN